MSVYMGSITNEHYVHFGIDAEIMAAKWIKSIVSTSHTVVITNNGTDIEVIDSNGDSVLKVEVKAARKGKDGKWRATLYKRDATDYRKSDVVLLLCCECGTDYAIPYVIPTKDIDQPHIAITSDPRAYAGKWASYRNNLTALNSVRS